MKFTMKATRQELLLGAIPHSNLDVLDKNGVLNILPCYFYPEKQVSCKQKYKDNFDLTPCTQCRHDFWTEEIGTWEIK